MTSVDWNTSIDFWHLVVARADVTPDGRMLVDEQGREMTFGQYRIAAEQVAAGLAALGVRRSEVVIWQLPTWIESAVLMAALSRLGVVQNPIIPMLRKAEVGVIASQLQNQWYLTPGTWRGFDYTALANEIAEEHGYRVLEVSKGTGTLGLPVGDADALPPYEPSSEVRWVYYTSGTTALPKGVRHTDATVCSASDIVVDALSIGWGDVLPMATPIAHVGGMMLLAGQLRQGFELGLLESFDPVESPLFMSRMGATALGSAVPFFLAYLAAQRRQPATPLFPNLRVCMAGGAPFPPELNAQVRAKLGARVINAWGLTECPSTVSLTLDDPESAFGGSVGRPLRSVALRIVKDNGDLAGPGEEGELRVKAPQLFVGYVDSGLDDDAFDAEGYLRTGDLGLVDETGYVHITGRIKDIIIRNAENISAVEVENVLHQHPSIIDVAVVGVPDPTTGERACAVIVLAPGATPLTVRELGEYCTAHGLARQKSPEHVSFRDTLPRNSMGKLLKQELRAQLMA